MTSSQLARELEVTPRTILRDVDALTEAGLPIIVLQGNQGGIELGFNYRTRLTGLSLDEAEAIALILSKPVAELAALGLENAGQRTRSKLIESFPDPVRERIAATQRAFRFPPQSRTATDPRVPALANAIRQRKIVRILAKSDSPRTIHPVGLMFSDTGWQLIDANACEVPIPESACGDVNISARSF
jgi:predicted DNA-binding transcriptional regulator YafY